MMAKKQKTKYNCNLKHPFSRKTDVFLSFTSNQTCDFPRYLSVEGKLKL